MTNGKNDPAAAPPTAEQFRARLTTYEDARGVFLQARSALEAAQADQAEAVNALPEAQRADIAQLEVIGDRLRINALGDEAFATMEAVSAALDALMEAPAGTPLELFVKMREALSAPFEAGDYSTRLLADAGTLTLLFGGVWLERWTHHGGTITADWKGEDRLLLGRGIDGSPARLAALLELEALLDAMPDGRASVRSLVHGKPELGLGKAVRA